MEYDILNILEYLFRKFSLCRLASLNTGKQKHTLQELVKFEKHITSSV